MSLVDLAWLPLHERARSKLLVGVLIATHVLAVPAFILVTRIGQTRFFGFFSVIFLAVLLLDVLLLSSDHEPKFEPADWAVWHVIVDHRSIASVLAVGVIVLTAVGFGFWYFVTMSIFYALLLIREIAVDTSSGERRHSLLLLTIGTVFLIAAQLTAVPYLVRTSDTIRHTTLALRIADVGFIGDAMPGRYGNLPVFHVLMASMVQIADQPSRLYIGLVVAVLFQVTLVAMYVILRKFTESPGVSFSGALLMAISVPFLNWATQNHAQSLSFVFLVLFLLILGARVHDGRDTVLSFIIVLTWVLTHQLSLLMSIALIGIPLVALYSYNYVHRSPFETEIKKAWVRLSTLVVVLVTYWTIVTQILREPISWLFYSSPGAQGVATLGYLVETYTDFGSLVRASLPEIVDKSHYVVWLALAALGLWTVSTTISSRDRYRIVALLSFIPAAVFFFPNPAWIPLQGIALITRWGIMAIPFIVLLPALGVRRLLTSETTLARSVLTVLVIFGLVFLSVGGGMTTPNVTDMAGYDKRTPRYLAETDFAAMDYVFVYSDNTTTTGTSAIPYYLISYAGKYRNQPGSAGIISADIEAGEFTFARGLNVIQMHQLIHSQTRVAASTSPLIFARVSSDTVTPNETRASRVYDSDDTVIYYSSEQRQSVEIA